jgi:hypothetical protein
MCARLVHLKKVIEALAGSDMWVTVRSKAPVERNPTFDRAHKSIERATFWGSLQRITNAMQPMREVLRLTDSQKAYIQTAYARGGTLD